ncbi:MAG: AAA family ATPase, partial [Anaerolineales bacterium]|nr:AAA family ATPase [Anaerolineales bacterium]
MTIESHMAHERVQVERALVSLAQQTAVFEQNTLRTILTVLREKLANLEAESQPKTAQRKQISVLFATVSGFTRLAESLSDTGMLDLMNLLWGRLGSAIREEGGTIDKYMGDGVMGLFGVPVVQEDDPVRALRAALSMRAALAEFLQDLQQAPPPTTLAWQAENGGWQPQLHELQVRIGINTGPVLLGQVGTTDEYTVIGDAVNVARRLEQSAPSGSILISHDTYLLLQGLFDVEPVGPVAMKGRLDPVPAYLVLGARRRAPLQASRGVEGIQTRMVGRDAELAQLQEVVYQTMRSRSGRLLTVMGEAGVGKTRLIHEFRKWVRSLSTPGMIVLKGRSERGQRPLPYTLIRNLIVRIFNIRDSDRAAMAEEKLVQGMDDLMHLPDAEIKQRARIIGQLIGLGGPDAGMLAVLEPDTLKLRERAFQYVSDLFAAVTARTPVTILILEDLHWSDQESIELIKHLSRLCAEAPLLIVSLARIGLFEKDPTWLTKNPPGVHHEQ